MRDPYSILGISNAADAQAVRRAYKKLAVQFHPDRNSDADAATRFKEVAEAYAVLTNERERKRYARRRHQEHAEREQRRKEAAEATRRRSAAQRSETAAAAERAFWDYARQVRQRRAQNRSQSWAHQKTAKVPPQMGPDRWWDDLGAVAAIVLMAIYVWRAVNELPLQPWLAGEAFRTHSLGSPIWITLSLALFMVVKPRWFLVPILIDKVRDARLAGWAMILIFPFLSATGPFYFLVGSVIGWRP